MHLESRGHPHRDRHDRGRDHHPCAFVDQERAAASATRRCTRRRKGNQWYFGLKAHIGVDAKQGIVHSVCTTAACVADKHMLPDLLHGEERKVWGDGGYQGQTEVIREAAPQAQDMTCRRTKLKDYVDELQRAKNRVKSRVRAKVEHPFRILKRVFGFEKVRYRGIEEEPSPAVRLLRAGEPLSAPQTAGPARGVVCPEPAKAAGFEPSGPLENNPPSISPTLRLC